MCNSLFGRTVTVQKILKPCGTVPYEFMDAVIRDKLREIGDDNNDVFLPDLVNKIYKKSDVQSYSGLEEVSSISFINEEHDCDDFAAELFGKFAGLVWTTLHAFNWFVDENYTLWYVEPQTKKLSQTIEGWQGTDVRFFLGR